MGFFLLNVKTQAMYTLYPIIKPFKETTILIKCKPKFNVSENILFLPSYIWYAFKNQMVFPIPWNPFPRGSPVCHAFEQRTKYTHTHICGTGNKASIEKNGYLN